MNQWMNESMNECVSFGFHCLYVALFLLLSDICFLCLCGFFELILSWNVKQARTFFRFLFPASSFLLYRALSLFTCAHTHTHRRARTHTHAHTQIHTLPKKNWAWPTLTPFLVNYIPSTFLFLSSPSFVYSIIFCFCFFLFFLFLYFVIMSFFFLFVFRHFPLWME